MTMILASQSPRRMELLKQVGCKFKVLISKVKEDNEKALPPIELAIHHAREKALDVAAQVSSNEVVIGADTIVLLDGKVFGKPSGAEDARYMLKCLAGRQHEVITGVAVVKGETIYTDYQVTKVCIRQLSDEEIERYIATGESFDKAGAYAIQGVGTLLVEGIVGCYSNVVGLPLITLSKLLSKVGIQLL